MIVSILSISSSVISKFVVILIGFSYSRNTDIISNVEFHCVTTSSFSFLIGI